MIRFREYPLLNTPNMVATVMRAASSRPVTLEGCVAALESVLGRAEEHPPFRSDEIADRLRVVVRMLTDARLLVDVGDAAFALTPRGRTVLADHPEGFDAADLMAFPDFARHVRALDRRTAALDPRAGGYDRGFAAYWSGHAPADNPYSPDTADHQAWENGWSEALDEDHQPPGR